MIRTRLIALAAAAAVGVLAWTGVARAGDDVPAAPAAKAAPAAATEAVTKTPSPVISMLAWVGSQVAPTLECGCPAKPEGEKAYRAWFDGGKDVPLAALRDRLVSDGWTADRFVDHFKKMTAKGACGDKASCDGAPCGDKKTGCCEGKAEGRADGKPCCGGCKEKKAETAEAPPAKPVEEKKP